MTRDTEDGRRDVPERDGGRPIFDPTYWRGRLNTARAAGQLHRAVFLCGGEEWAKIEAAHRTILAAHVTKQTSVLDVGCGYGRLLDLLPADWDGPYLGLDLSQDFIRLARQRPVPRRFDVHDLRQPAPVAEGVMYDLAVLVSVRPMILREAGPGVWAQIERNVRAAARKLLYLEYDPADGGSLE